ncbi:MAG TPA: hypothetical protein DCP69_04355 [Candidatus Omnitrophica bacterium]|nr:hypothetical protein [Candidatus Omnitrophota bacterium]
MQARARPTPLGDVTPTPLGDCGIGPRDFSNAEVVYMWFTRVKRIWGWVVKKFKRGEAGRRVEWSPLPDPREVALLWADERLPKELKHLLLKAYGLCPCCDTYRPLGPLPDTKGWHDAGA